MDSIWKGVILVVAVLAFMFFVALLGRDEA